MTYLEQILNGLSALREVFQLRSIDDIKILVVVFVLVLGYPLFLILKGRAKEFFAGLVLGGFFGMLLGNFFVLAWVLGSVVLRSAELIWLFYVILVLLVIGIIAKITFKNYIVFAWVFSVCSLLVTIYVTFQNYLKL